MLFFGGGEIYHKIACLNLKLAHGIATKYLAGHIRAAIKDRNLLWAAEWESELSVEYRLMPRLTCDMRKESVTRRRFLAKSKRALSLNASSTA